MRSVITYPDPILHEGSVPRARKPRIASEKADIEHLLGALRFLCTEIVKHIGPPGAGYKGPLRRSVYAARDAEYRVVQNKTARAKRKPRR